MFRGNPHLKLATRPTAGCYTCFVRIVCALWLLIAAGPLLAQEQEQQNPFAKLDKKTRAKMQAVLDRPTVVVPCGERTIKTTEAVYDFLIQHLDLTGRLVTALGVGKYVITRKDKQQFLVDDKAGAIATIRPLTSFPKSGQLYRLFLAEGHFKLPLGQKVHGSAMIILSYKTTEKGVYTNADIYFRAKAGTLHLLGKQLRPLLRQVLKKKAVLFIKAAREVSQATTADPQKIHRLIQQDKQMPPKLSAEFSKRFLSN